MAGSLDALRVSPWMHAATVCAEYLRGRPYTSDEPVHFLRYDISCTRTLYTPCNRVGNNSSWRIILSDIFYRTNDVCDLSLCTVARPIIRNPEKKKFLTLLGSCTLTSTIIPVGLLTTTLYFNFASYYWTGTCLSFVFFRYPLRFVKDERSDGLTSYTLYTKRHYTWRGRASDAAVPLLSSFLRKYNIEI
jgi:hypothetical protein